MRRRASLAVWWCLALVAGLSAAVARRRSSSGSARWCCSYAIAASAWNIVGGYAGQVSVGHVVFFGCGAYAAMGAYAHFALSPLAGHAPRHRGERRLAAVVGVPTLRLSRPLFQHGDDRRRRAGPASSSATADYPRRGRRPEGPTDAAQLCSISRSAARCPTTTSFLAVLAATARHHLVDGAQPHGLLSARHPRRRARGAHARRAGQALQAVCASC